MIPGCLPQVIAFAARAIKRTRREKEEIERMWADKTTVQGLRKMVQNGRPLPPVVLLRGNLNADGPAVDPISPSVRSLVPLLGKIDQPSNIFLDMADDVKSGRVKLPANVKIDDSDILIQNDELLQRSSGRDFQYDLLISELLVTRLGCEAFKMVKNYTVTVPAEGDEKLRSADSHSHDTSLIQFLASLGFEKFYDVLKGEDISSTSDLRMLDKEDLRRLGFSLGQQARLAKALETAETVSSSTHSVSPLLSFLESLGFEKFYDALVAEDITSLSDLRNLDKDDLRHLGFSIGQQAKVTKALAASQAVSDSADSCHPASSTPVPFIQPIAVAGSTRGSGSLNATVIKTVVTIRRSKRAARK